MDTTAKFDCLKTILEKNPQYSRSHWTSGAFLDCEERAKYSWCGLKEDLETSAVTWGQGQPPSAKVDTCLSLVLATGKAPYLEAINCNSTISYICEASFINIDEIELK